MANMKTVSLIDAEIKKAQAGVRADLDAGIARVTETAVIYAEALHAQIERLRADVERAFDVVGEELERLKDAIEPLRHAHDAHSEEAPAKPAEARQDATEERRADVAPAEAREGDR